MIALCTTSFHLLYILKNTHKINITPFSLLINYLSISTNEFGSSCPSFVAYAAIGVFKVIDGKDPYTEAL